MNALQALNQARAAWAKTQPQLTIEGWADMLDGLDGLDGLDDQEMVKRAAECPAAALLIVEPASRRFPLAADGGLAPETSNGRGASSCPGARRGQKEATP